MMGRKREKFRAVYFAGKHELYGLYGIYENQKDEHSQKARLGGRTSAEGRVASEGGRRGGGLGQRGVFPLKLYRLH